ncbi:MAG: hypothetical protein ABII68_06650 [Pseudomonadota bacterium]
MESNILKRSSLNSKILCLCLLIALFFPLRADSAVIVLKNGMRLNAAKVWEEKSKVKCLINGLVMGFSVEDVARIEDDPGKRKAFDAEAPAGAVEKEKARTGKPFDREKFSKMLESFNGRPVTEFIDKWGYPDTVFRIQDGTFEYLFVIEVDPSCAQDVYFKTDPVGKIVGFRSEERTVSPPAPTE